MKFIYLFICVGLTTYTAGLTFMKECFDQTMYDEFLNYNMAAKTVQRANTFIKTRNECNADDDPLVEQMEIKVKNQINIAV